MPYLNSRLCALLAMGLSLVAVPGLRAQDASSVAAPAAIRGDVNGDGRVTRADADAVRTWLVRGTPPDGRSIMPAGDANGDGRITAADAALISRFAAGVDVSRFPVGRPVGAGGERVTGGALVSTEYECTADFRSGNLTCGVVSPAGTSGARMDLILGGDAAKLVNMGGGAYSGTDKSNPDTMTYNFALRNLIPQPIGTTDGINPDTSRLIITSYRLTSPQTTAWAQLATADDTATFTDSLNFAADSIFSNKEYVNFPGLLKQDSTSATKLFRFVFSPSVTAMRFTYRTWTRVRYLHGYVTIAPADSVLGAGQTLTFSANAFTAHGTPSGGVTWSSSNPAVASVGAATGVVTGVAGGTATITATSTVDSRRTATRVINVIKAWGDDFVVTGNVRLNSPTSVVTDDVMHGTTTITYGWGGTSGVTEKGGTVVMDTEGDGLGTFTYDPPAGFAGVDNLEYTIHSGSAVSTANVALTVGGMIWFVGTGGGCDPDAAGADNKCGRLSDPYPTLAAFQADNTGAGKPKAGDAIFLYDGTHTANVTLLPQQRLIGQDAVGDDLETIAGIDLAEGSDPLPSMTADTATTIDGSVVLANVGSGSTLNNTVRGLTIAPTAAGMSALSGTNFGTLTTAADLIINYPLGQALSLTTGMLTGGGFGSLTSGGGTHNVFLSSVKTNGLATLGVAGDSLVGASNDAFRVTGEDGSFTYAGTIRNTSTFRAVNVNGKTGGTVTFSGPINPGVTLPAAGVSLTSNTGASIAFNGGVRISTTTTVPFTATGGGTVEVTGASNTISLTAAPGTVRRAVNLNGITLGANGMTFASIQSTSTDSTAFSATNVGGSSFTAGSLSVTGTNNAGSRGLDLTTNSAPFTFTTASVSGTAAEGIYLNGNTGAVAVNGGSVATTAGDALFVSGGNAGVTVAANLSKSTAGRIANIASRTGGTTTISGSINCTGACTGILGNANAGTINFTNATQTLNTGTSAAVTLTNNTGATINFTGGNLDIDVTSGAGFTATGGGTVNVEGANNTVNATLGGTPVNIQNTAIGGNGVRFFSVNAAGSGTNGIVLSNTGAGAFQVTGDGASDPNNTTRGRTTAKEGGGTVGLNSGGSISGRSGHGVSLSSTGPVILRNMLITGSGSSGDGINASTVARLTVDNTRITGHASDHGILGNSVSGFALHHSEVDNNGTTVGVVEGPDIWNIRLLGLTGTDSIRNSNIHHSQENVLGIINTSGVLNLTVLNTNITDTGTGAGGTSALMVAANGTSNVTLNLQNDSINRGRSRGLQTGTETGSSAVLNLTVNNSQFHQNGAAIDLSHGSGGTNTFSITNNNLQAGAGSLQALIVNRLGSPSFNGFGLFTGTVSGNTIGTAGTANSGSDTSNGIEVESNGSGGIMRVAVVNNTVREVGLHGIYVAAVDANIGGTAPPLLEARVASNTVSNMKATALDGINILPGALNTDDLTMCIDIANNNSTGIRNGLRVRPSGLPAAPSTVQLEGWDGVTAVNTYFTARPNTLAGGIAAISTTAPPSPGGFFAVANCNTP
ncbi:MAG TPA: dockerin type I domain-containing protein [Longimicrobium sp.]|jgi:hypothetical protein|uniref:dockerin type I domain-containing protein n=1 Tax=Longimicrobium sp. TaxID=2029185 RepID=UPI002ED8E6D0